jgi:beta-lactamase class A
MHARPVSIVLTGIALTLGGLPACAQESRPAAGDVALAQRLRALSRPAGGTVGIAAIHVESGRTVEVQGRRALPLYSVFKLPLAVVVLKDVEAGRLRLDQKVKVTPQEVVRGSAENTALWRTPVDRSIRELMEMSIVRSDNTSSDVLLRLAGGPAGVTARLRALGFGGIAIRQPVKAFLAAPRRAHPNTASAMELARLLSRLYKGEIVQPAGREILLGFMAQATTGLHRLRGGLPPGTPVADKSGTGPAGTATNDVGMITLPGGKGHLAMAVLVVGSKAPLAAQEKLIADLARAAYDAYVLSP